MSSPKVYILILNYLQWKDTGECIESVLKSSYDNYSVIIVDNNSGNRSLQNIIERLGAVSTIDYKKYDKQTFSEKIDPRHLSRLTFVQNDENAGFAGGNNVALRRLADLDAYVWLLNPDMIVGENTLAELVHFAERQTADCIIGAEVRSFSNEQDPPLYGGGVVNFFTGSVRPVLNSNWASKLDYISGGCLFTRAVSFKKHGILPEEYFLSWEETDWCYRAKENGVALLVCPSAVCYHKTSTVIGRGFLADYYYCRNGLFFIAKFRKRNMPIALCGMLIRMLKRVVSGDWNKARGAYQGTVDFLAGKDKAREFRGR